MRSSEGGPWYCVTYRIEGNIWHVAHKGAMLYRSRQHAYRMLQDINNDNSGPNLLHVYELVFQGSYPERLREINWRED